MNFKSSWVVFIVLLAIAATFVVLRYPTYVLSQRDAIVERYKQSKERCPSNFICVPKEQPE